MWELTKGLEQAEVSWLKSDGRSGTFPTVPFHPISSSTNCLEIAQPGSPWREPRRSGSSSHACNGCSPENQPQRQGHLRLTRRRSLSGRGAFSRRSVCLDDYRQLCNFVATRDGEQLGLIQRLKRKSWGMRLHGGFETWRPEGHAHPRATHPHEEPKKDPRFRLRLPEELRVSRRRSLGMAKPASRNTFYNQ